MRKSTINFSFWSNPIRWSYNKVFAMLPLMWKIKVATLHVSWMTKKQILLDRYLGQRYVSIRYVYQDWGRVEDETESFMLREIAFVYKRRNVPWALTKELRGFQCDTVEAYPILSSDREQVITTIKFIRAQIQSINKRIDNLNEQHRVRQQQIAAFKNPAPANHL